jgi:uncharacterized protein (TIGR03437 family)
MVEICRPRHDVRRMQTGCAVSESFGSERKGGKNEVRGSRTRSGVFFRQAGWWEKCSDWKPCFCLICLLSTVMLPGRAQVVPQYYITTVAGAGSAGMSGDPGAAISAQLNSPASVAADESGNLYIADTFNNRIRRVAPDGGIATFAGGATTGYSSGDGGPATSAGLSRPNGIALDRSGTLYIADTAGNMIRKVSAGGTITRVAGTGAAGFSGDGGAATDATLNTPIGVALDAAGNLYIADSMNHRIRRVGTDGKITTVAGNGFGGYYGDGVAATDTGLNHPQGVAVDAGGNLYIADTFSSRIRVVTPDGIIRTFAGNGIPTHAGDGGPATAASLNYPKGIAFDASGNLFIADCFNSRIRLVTADGRISTVAGSGALGYGGDGGKATSAKLQFPSGVAVGINGNVFVADTANHRIRLLSPTADVTLPPSIRLARVAGPVAFGGASATAPGSWIEVFGTNLAPVAKTWSAEDFVGGKAPRSLSGTSITVGGRDAFVSYVSPNQVNALVPFDAGVGQQTVTVTTASGTSVSDFITVNRTEPGLMAPSSLKVGDRQYVAAQFPDGTYALPSQAISGVASRPARPSETIILYGIGFGPVTPPMDAGEIVQVRNAIDLPVEIAIGGTPARLTYAGLALGTVGMYQFNVVVPNVLSSDAVPLTYSLGGVKGGQTLFIAVQN